MCARFLVLAALAAGCSGDDGGGGTPPLFPTDYAASYQEVRNCRASIEHGAVRIRVLAAPDALTPYTGRTAPFPTGAIVLKEEYDDSDLDCTGPKVNYTVMQKLDVGSSAETLDWTWQEVGPDLKDREADIRRCYQCHTDCNAPEGYDHTCTVP